MSVQAMGAVLERSQAVKGARLTLLSIANHADKHGIGFLSVRLIKEEAKLERTAVRTALSTLRDLGELEVAIEDHGRTHRPPLYRICLEGLDGVIVDDHPYLLIFGTLEELLGDPGSENDPGGVRNPTRDPGRKTTPDPGRKTTPDPGRISTPPGVGIRPHPGSDSDIPPYREPSIKPLESPPGASPGYLANILADLIAANDPDGVRPTVGKEWLDAERLLLTKDGRDLDVAERVLRWSQADEFWRKNVRSMPKFRLQYGRLFLEENKPSKGAPKERAKPKPDNVYDMKVVRSG